MSNTCPSTTPSATLDQLMSSFKTSETIGITSAPRTSAPRPSAPANAITDITSAPSTASNKAASLNKSLTGAEAQESEGRTTTVQVGLAPSKQTLIRGGASTDLEPGETPSGKNPANQIPENPFVALPEGQNPPSTPQPASTAGSKTKTKGTIGHGQERPSKQSYTPRITLAKGANPALRKGPDERLLLWVDKNENWNKFPVLPLFRTTYGAWEGPDPDLRKGPQRSNARGPNPLNRRR